MPRTTARDRQPGADARAAQRRRDAAPQRQASFLEMLSPDRTCIRSPLAVIAVDPSGKARALPANHLFTAPGNIEFVTMRPETLAPLRIKATELLAAPLVVDGRRFAAGMRLRISRPANGDALEGVRLFVDDHDALAALLHLGQAFVVGAGGALREARLIASGIEGGDDLYPTPPLGCRGRSLLAAYFHAPHALGFVDVASAPVAGAELEILLAFPRASDAANIDRLVPRIGCVPVLNRRTTSVNVTVKPTCTFAPILLPEGASCASIGRVQAHRGDGQWQECRRWLGARFPMPHRRDFSQQYFLSGRGGEEPLSIGLVDSGGLDAVGANLNVELLLSDPQAGQLEPGGPWSGDQGEKAALVARCSPLLVPVDIAGAELETEQLAAGWLARSRPGDVTDALRAILEQSAGGVRAIGRTAPSPRAWDAIVTLERATLRVESGPQAPLLALDLELCCDAADLHRAFFFAAVLERSLPLFASPLAGTQLSLHTAHGDHTWQTRWPIG